MTSENVAQWKLIAWHSCAVGSLTAMVFVSVILVESGLKAAEAAAVLLLLPVGKLVTGPMWSWAADQLEPHLILRVAATASALAMVALAAAPTPEALIASVALIAVCRPGAIPIGDALTVRLLGDNRRDYGRIRSAGSVVFAVLILLDGWLRLSWPRGPLVLGAGCMVLGAAVTWTLPAPRSPAGARPALSNLWALLRQPILGPLLLAGLLHGWTLSTYDHFIALHFEQLGGPQWTGVAMALGVAAEVVVLFYARSLLDRRGPLFLLVLAMVVTIPRWIITGWAPGIGWVVLVQILHGATYGAWWIAGVALFNERAPEQLQTSSQALFASVSFGGGYLVAMSVASATLDQVTVGQLFISMGAVSVFAAGITAVAARRSAL